MKRHPEEIRAAAVALRAGGMSIAAVARKLGLPRDTVRTWVEPGRPEKMKAYKATLPAEVKRAWVHRQKRRMMAREEAAATGEDLEAVYQRFGVSTRRVSKHTNNGE